jgi:hypothetical protein
MEVPMVVLNSQQAIRTMSAVRSSEVSYLDQHDQTANQRVCNLTSPQHVGPMELATLVLRLNNGRPGE